MPRKYSTDARDQVRGLLDLAIQAGVKGELRELLEQAREATFKRKTKGLAEIVYRDARQNENDIIDPDFPGLRMRVTSRGKRWIYRGEVDGRMKQIPIGDYPALSLEVARTRWVELREANKAGTLAIGTLSGGAAAGTVAALVQKYIGVVSDPNQVGGQKSMGRFKRSWRQDMQALQRDVLPLWGKRRPEDIKHGDVKALINKVREGVLDHRPEGSAGRGGERAAMKLLAVCKFMFNVGMTREWIANESNPCDKLGLAPSRNRDSGFSENSVATFLRNLDNSGLEEDIRSILRLQLMTASRCGEIAGLAWSEVDLDRGIITLPPARTKNGQQHRIMLPRQATAILGARKENGSPYVFPLPTKSDQATNTSRVGRLVKSVREGGVKAFPDAFTTHFLRHWATSMLASLKVRREVRDRITNHISSRGIDGRYNAFEFDEDARDGLQRLADELDVLAAENVVRLNTERGAA